MDKKTLSNTDKKVAVQAELLTGANSRKLADAYGVAYSTVVGWRNEQRDGLTKASIADVAHADEVTLLVVAEEIKAKTAEVEGITPSQLVGFENKVDALVEGVSSLQLLEKSFHTTATKLLSWANANITDDMDIKTWDRIATRVGQLHKDIFASGAVVNVQQNNSTSNSFTTGMVN